MPWMKPLSDMAREAYDRELYKNYYGCYEEYEPKCRDCEHFVRKTDQCEHEIEDDVFELRAVDPDGDSCGDFKQAEYDPYDNEPDFDYYEYLESKKRED